MDLFVFIVYLFHLFLTFRFVGILFRLVLVIPTRQLIINFNFHFNTLHLFFVNFCVIESCLGIFENLHAEIFNFLNHNILTNFLFGHINLRWLHLLVKNLWNICDFEMIYHIHLLIGKQIWLIDCLRQVLNGDIFAYIYNENLIENNSSWVFEWDLLALEFWGLLLYEVS